MSRRRGPHKVSHSESHNQSASPGDPGDHKEVERLAALVSSEAKRSLSESMTQPNPALISQGWERRFVVDVKRVPEIIELYQELGYEVFVDSIGPDQLNHECGDCRLLVLLEFKTLYTRKKR